MNSPTNSNGIHGTGIDTSGDYVAIYQLDEAVESNASRAASSGDRLAKDTWDTLAALRLVKEARGHEPDLARALNRLLTARVLKLAAVCDPVEGARNYSRSPMVAAYWMTNDEGTPTGVQWVGPRRRGATYGDLFVYHSRRGTTAGRLLLQNGRFVKVLSAPRTLTPNTPPRAVH